MDLSILILEDGTYTPIEKEEEKKEEERVMSSVIRKISIGSDYKTDAMHYSLRAVSVWRSHNITYTF